MDDMDSYYWFYDISRYASRIRTRLTLGHGRAMRLMLKHRRAAG